MTAASENTPRQLTAKQRRALDALLDPNNLTIEAAAAASGTPSVTLRRWRKLPHFAAALADAVGELRADVVRRLAVTAVHAVEILNAGLRGEATRLQVRSAELTLRFVFGERVVTIEQTVRGGYVIESPPQIAEIEAWKMTWIP